MMANSGKYLFYLVPLNHEAEWVVQVQQKSNSKYVGQRPGGGALCLAFGIHQDSTAGRLATFGRHKNNDVTLPSHAKPKQGKGHGENAAAEQNLKASSGHAYQNYRNHHCFFFLAKSGELILRDLSPRLVHVEVENATPDEATLYALHGSPRQRVIPRIDRHITIIIGTSTYFALEWANNLVDPETAPQPSLASQARALAVPGTTPTPPGRCSRSHGSRGLHSRELHSSHTPSVASKAGPIKSCHKYQALGAGGFGTVYKVVDLSSGELWAVKEIDSTKKIGSSNLSELKVSLIQEVETMAKLSHVSNAASLSQSAFQSASRRH
jgi:hypothetical protein